MSEQNYWRRCGSCKKEIAFKALYQRCSISSCRKHAYCSVDCWSQHDAVMGHKSAWAEEIQAPEKETVNGTRTPQRKIINTPKAVKASNVPKDVLVVASKLKNYVKDRHDFNTSGNVMECLSDLIRNLVDDAIDNARSEGRKTLMDRDFK